MQRLRTERPELIGTALGETVQDSSSLSLLPSPLPFCQRLMPLLAVLQRSGRPAGSRRRLVVPANMDCNPTSWPLITSECGYMALITSDRLDAARAGDQACLWAGRVPVPAVPARLPGRRAARVSCHQTGRQASRPRASASLESISTLLIA